MKLIGKFVYVSEDEISDGTLGICIECGEASDEVEPDAHEYVCKNCGSKSVYGLQELLMMGKIEIEDE